MKRFIFNFHHEENGDGDGVVYFFEITPKPDDPKCNECAESQEWLDFVGGTMEFYGVHDFCTSGDDELIGYHSDAVVLADQQIVVQKWHDYLTTNGFQPGTIQMLNWDDYEARFHG